MVGRVGHGGHVGRRAVKVVACHGVFSLLLSALLLAGCDPGPSLPDVEDQPYFRVKVEAAFDGEPVTIEGVAHCELSKRYRDDIITNSPPIVVARLRPGLIGTRLKEGVPGALYVATPRVCQHILKQDRLRQQGLEVDLLPKPAEGYIPLLAWFENPGESPRSQLYLHDAYHEGTESRIRFKSFAIAEATYAEYRAWQAGYQSGPDAPPLDPNADYQMKYLAPDISPDYAGGLFGCDYGLRIPPEIWRKDPIIVEWVENQSGDGRYWTIPLPPNEERSRDNNNAYARTLIARDNYIRDGEGKWLGLDPLVFQLAGMTHPENTTRYAFDRATLRRVSVPITQDIWDFYLPYRYTADGAAFSPETVGVVECGQFSTHESEYRQWHRIEGLRDGDWKVASGFFYDTLTDEFIVKQTTELKYSSAY